MDSLDDHHYTLNKFLLSCIGLWPYEQTWFTYVKRVFYLLIMVSALMIQTSKLLICEVFSINIVVDAMTNIIYIVLCLLKHVLCLCNLKGVKQILEMIREDWRQINNEYEMSILLRNADDGKFMGMILSVGMYVMMTSSAVYTTIMYNSNSTSTVYSRVNHLASLMHTHMLVFLEVMTLAGTELTTVLCGHHFFGMIQILSYRVRNAFNDAVVPKKERVTIAKLIDVAIVHRRMLRFRQLVGGSALMGYFFVLGLGIASLVMNLLRFSYAMLKIRRLLQILPSAAVIIGHFLYMGVMNHLGQMVIDDGAKFFSDTYNGIWYRASVPAQKLLLFIMCHSSKDVSFVLGGIYCPSYEGFTAMMNLSVSYLMVMYSVDI